MSPVVKSVGRFGISDDLTLDSLPFDRITPSFEPVDEEVVLALETERVAPVDGGWGLCIAMSPDEARILAATLIAIVGLPRDDREWLATSGLRSGPARA